MMRRAILYRLRTVWTDDLVNGIFAHLQNLDVPWKNLNIYGTLDLAYHGNHSGDKIVSPVIDRYLDAADDEKELTEAQKTMLAAVCFNLYGSKWDKLYNILSLEYNPISNYDMTEQETTNEAGENSEAHAGTDRTTNTGTVQDAKTGTAEKTNTGTVQDAKTGTEEKTNTGTETTAYTDEVERSGTDQKRQTGTETVAGTDQTTTSGTSSIENGIAGFNSSSYKDSTNSDGTTSGSGSLTRNETRTPNLTENGTTSGTESLEHSETRTPNLTEESELSETSTRTDNLTEESEVSETSTRTDNLTQALTHGETVTGTDEREITRELTRSGNIGVTTSQQMIQSEIELWQWNFFMTVFNDIDTVLTIQVY